MLSHLSIKDFAIIKDLELQLQPGLNIITGETGAGKSIVIEAVSMALGSRADTDYIRTGAQKACIALSVDVEDPIVNALLEENGIPQDEPLVIRREISAGKKSLCRVNGTIVPLSFLGTLCRRLADIHGQYDTQALLDADGHIDVLDLYGGSELQSVLSMVRGFYADMTRTEAALSELQSKMADAQRRKDFARFEMQEIDAACIQEGEDERLEEELRMMNNSERICQTLSQIYDAVYESDGSATDKIGSSLASLRDISSLSQELSDAVQQFEGAFYVLDELGRDIRRLRDSVTFSEAELEEKTERLDLLDRLKRKYGGSLQAVLAHREQAAQEVQTMEHADEELQELESKGKLYREQYETAAMRLNVLRNQTAKTLQEEVGRELADLNFSDAALCVSMETTTPGEKGTDRVEFLIRTNEGDAFKPLAKIASGGELSRIMLALKRILGDLDSIPTMIFDEIDAGISGAAAGAVGEKLRAIAKDHQIVCITHLPQIAALGDHHYRIEKNSDGISVQTTVVPLSEEERVEELARLLSGTVVTESARQQAKELLQR